MIQRLFGSKRTLRDLGSLLSGTVLSQVVVFAAMVPLARLYSPAAFGLFAVVQTIVNIGITLSALRYDNAIVLPESRATARVVTRLASALNLVTCILLGIVLIVAHGWVTAKYESEAFAWWLTAASIIVYVMAEIGIAQRWLLREKKFKAIASNRFIGAVAVAVGQLAAAYPIGGFQGLIAGMLVGQGVTLLLVLRRTPELLERLPEDAPTLTNMAVRYRKMPLLNGPSAVLDAVRNAGITFFISSISVAGLGQYSLANRAALAPVSLINGTITQVFLQKMAVAKQGEMLPLVRSVSIRIAMLTAPLFIVFYLLAPELFPWLFGRQWMDAGIIAQALTPWLFLNTVSSPLHNVFIVTEHQGWLLAFSTLYTVLPLAYLATHTQALIPAVQGMAWLMSGSLVFMIGLTFVIAVKFDRDAKPTVTD